MKLRKGFVANSSSSSYVCDICNHAESGYDVYLSDVGMCECTNDHVFCLEHLKEELPDYPSKSSIIKECTNLIEQNKRYIKDTVEREDNGFKQYNIDMYNQVIKDYQKTIDTIRKIDDSDSEAYEEFLDENNILADLDIDMNCRIPPEYCPICSLTAITEDTRYEYLAKKFGYTREEIDAEIKSNFSDYDGVKKYLKN